MTSEQYPGREHAEDLPLLERLLTAVRRPGPGLKPHFVFFSSGGTVYGNAAKTPSREEDACRPIGSYGRAKLAAENIIKRFQEAGSHSCAVLRISNPFGQPGDPGKPQGVINRAIACALSQTEFVVWGDGCARKDYLYQDDFLAALERIINCRLVGTYNLCKGESRSVNEVIEIVESQTGCRITRRDTPAPAWDVQDSRLDGNLLQQATSWRPIVPLQEGIKRAVAHFVVRTPCGPEARP